MPLPIKALFTTMLAAGLSLTISGCGKGEFPLAPVSGKVTMNGDPLPNATVTFLPQLKPGEKDTKSGPQSFGKTDSEGRFTLETVSDGSAGAVIGQHKVRITLNSFEQQQDDDDSGGSMKGKKNPIPEKYNSKTELTFTVPEGGSEKANFDLVNPNFKAK